MDPVSFYKNLADDTRLKSLLLIVAEGELCVCELTCALDVSQPKISRHLAQLRKADILLDRREGQWVYYRLNPTLPDWAKGVIESTAAANASWLSPCCRQLSVMGDRPQRKACC